MTEQPEDNGYNPDVFQALMALSDKFMEQHCFSVAVELSEMAHRGPERWKGLDHLSDSDVLELVADRLRRIAQTTKKPT